MATVKFTRGNRLSRIKQARETLENTGPLAGWTYKQWASWREENVDPEIGAQAPNTVQALNGLAKAVFAQGKIIEELLDMVERRAQK